MTTSEFAYAGTVSHGTLRSEDLIVAFLPIAMDLDPHFEGSLDCGPIAGQVTFSDVLEHLTLIGETDYPEAQEKDYQEAAAELSQYLIETLESAAPEGYVFGTTEGDGSDFGFREADDDED